MRSFADLIGATKEHEISFLQWAYNIDQIAFGRTLSDIDPFGGAVLDSNDEHSLTRTHHT